MTQRLTPSTIAMLTLAPLLWAGNAVVGRMVVNLVPPITLNFLRWVLALVILLPLARWVLAPGSGLWTHWRRFAVLGLLGVGLYNALQYMALHTSTPLNVTLVASSLPLWMLLIGRVGFATPVTRAQLIGALLSMAGVAVVLARGDWTQLARLRLVPGDVYMLAATFSWALYSWLLARPDEPEPIRADWAAFLLAQIVFGLGWSGLMTAGEWALTDARIVWGWPLAAALLFVAIGPAVLAYRCWGLGVQRAGPALAGFFSNLTPVGAALLSTLLLGQAPQLYHATAFALIVAGIVVSARR
ncbi:MAG: DMT family transporter [Burkholderiaceae bacterium]|jgi:drug/metabolite transporter (DMT)-like permease|nr:DMT family transporter [Burkholderiaceae bacterium]